MENTDNISNYKINIYFDKTKATEQFEVNDNMTLEALKQQVAEKVSTTPNEVGLYTWQGSEIYDDKKTLHRNGLEPGDTLIYAFKPIIEKENESFFRRWWKPFKKENTPEAMQEALTHAKNVRLYGKYAYGAQTKPEQNFENAMKDIISFDRKLADLEKVNIIAFDSPNYNNLVKHYNEMWANIVKENKNVSFLSFITNKIERVNIQLNSCRESCVTKFCSEYGDETCKDVDQYYKNSAFGKLSNKCHEEVKNDLTSRKKKIDIGHKLILINCLEVNHLLNEIVNLTYVWLKNTYDEYKKEGISNKLADEYNNVLDLANTYSTIFRDTAYKKIFRSFQHIDVNTTPKVPENSDLYCEKVDVDGADPFSLRCSWKSAGVEEILPEKNVSPLSEGGRRRKSLKTKRRKTKKKTKMRMKTNKKRKLRRSKTRFRV